MKIKDLTVVIRAAGERTLDLCHSLVSKQVEEQNIFIIEERPFSKAVLKNFEIGINKGFEYTLAVDADTLIFKDSIKLHIENFKKLDDSYFVYKGLVYDKFFKSYRGAGIHLYRTSLLEKAIKFIPKEGDSFRPESSTYIEMQKMGFHTYQDIWTVGIHDDEQYYQDIYRKFFLHAHKHRSRIKNMLDQWGDEWADDIDFQFALKGISDGMMFKETVFVDSDFFTKHFKKVKEQFNFDEKNKLNITEFKLDQSPFLVHESNEFFDSRLPLSKKKVKAMDKLKFKTGLQLEKWANYLKKY